MTRTKKIALWVAVALGFVLIPELHAKPQKSSATDLMSQRFSSAHAGSLPIIATYVKRGHHVRRGYHRNFRGYRFNRRHAIGIRPFVGRSYYRRGGFVGFNRPYARYRHRGFGFAPFGALGILPFSAGYSNFGYYPRSRYDYRPYYRTRYVVPYTTRYRYHRPYYSRACRVVHRGHAHIGRTVRNGCLVPSHRNLIFRHYTRLR